MTTEDEVFSRLRDVLFPYFQLRAGLAQANGGRFVYYTTAEVASQVLRNGEIWLRNALVMNDFSEIDHGLRCLLAAYHSPAGEVLKRALGTQFPGLPDEIEQVFDQRQLLIRSDTYLTCVSEHERDEDERGRLSMWRGYGRGAGAAIVLNGGVMFSSSDVLGAISSPVFYGDPDSFVPEFMKLAKGIEAEAQLIGSLGRDGARDAIFQMFRFQVLCTKHPGFREEREWRVIASPGLDARPRAPLSVEVIRGVPQKVVKIKLENAPSEGLLGLEIHELVDRIIIGPCRFPWVTQQAFIELLRDLKVPEPEKKVIVSDIPLRHDD